MIQFSLMKEPIVSIIVPVFNTAGFLPRCLDSLLAQTLRDIEIVCVDDGSTDGSAEILRDYVARDERVVAVFQENHGVEWARSVAMEKARGQYVMFCDSDDAYKPQMCERMVATIKANETDFAVCGTTLHGEFDAKYVKRHAKVDLARISVSELRRDDCLWNKIFKKELIDRSGLRFPRDPAIRRGFDSVFCFCYSLLAGTASTLSEELLDHYRREGSIQDRQRGMRLRSTLDAIYSLPVILDFMDRNNLYDRNRDRFLKWYDTVLRRCFRFIFPKELATGLRVVSETMGPRRHDVGPDLPWLFASVRQDEKAIRKLLKRLSGKSRPSAFSRFHSVCLSALSRWMGGLKRFHDRNVQLH